EHCPDRNGPKHHHYLVNIGRGFLGFLEQFAEVNHDGSIRTYRFPANGPKREPTLRKAGKTGDLIPIYLPAKIGEPSVCNSLSRKQHRLLQAVVREMTRAKKKKACSASQAELTTASQIPDFHGKSHMTCAFLDPHYRYVAFGGNRLRRGLGYYLASPGGWQAK